MMPKVLTYFADASGSAYQPNDVAQIVAGFLTNDDCWSGFCADWRLFLQRHGLKALHMSELTGDSEVRRSILDDAIAIITKPDYYLRRFVTLVDAPAFKRYQVAHGGSEFALGKENHAYPFAAYSHIASIEGFCAEEHIPTPRFVFEAGDPYQKELAKALADKSYPVPRLLPKRGATSGDDVLQFQACDFLAYEYLQGYRKKQLCDPKLQEPIPVGELSAYLRAFKEMRGDDGIWSEDNILKPKQVAEFTRRLLEIKEQQAGAPTADDITSN